MATATMNQQAQSQFMYLFERIGEPLYLAPRGANNSFVYQYPTTNLSEQDRDAMDVVGRMWSSNAPDRRAPAVVIDPNVRVPDLANIGRLCPRNTIYSYFIPNHRRATSELTAILMAEQDRNRFLAACALCRDDSRINCQLWLQAVASCCLTRPDMRGFRLPALVEISPSSFFNAHTMRQAREQGARPEQDRSVIIPERTSNENNEENRLAYFREDVGINSHHWHWHLIYHDRAPRTGPGSRDRKGELFYYMHHSMIARYNAERLCNRLDLANPMSLDQPMPEGYFPKLTDANSGVIWGTRQEGTRLSGVNRPEEGAMVTLEDMRKWGDRISEAIDSGVVMDDNNRRIPLTEEGGIDILGDIVENGGVVAPNVRFYGSYHNMGHVLIAFSHDPIHRHRESNGVMGDTPTAMRDPIFYRWHTHIDNVFDKYKVTLQPYTQQRLLWQGMQVNSIQVQTPNREPNRMYTFWMQRHADLARGLDFTRDAVRNGPIFARFTHLQHDPFTYTIQITNSSRQATQGTVRIFMAPRFNNNGQRFNFREQRLLFFEMDKFTTQLQPGQNTVQRRSSESSVTIPPVQTFRDLENLPQEPEDITGSQAVCGCGWPDHMLIPRGSTTGVTFDLFVMVTNAAEDVVPRRNNRTEAQRQGCKDAVSYCGVLDELYPDRKPMGFPFDRNAVNPGTNQPVENLDLFIQPFSNMRYVQVQIFHEGNRIVLAPDGGPTNRPLINAAGEVIRPPMNATSRPTQPTRPGTTQPARPGTTQPTRPGTTQPARPTRPPTRQPPRTPSPTNTNNTWGTPGIGRPVTFSPSPPPVSPQPWGSPGRGWSPNRSRSNSPDNFAFVG